MAGNAKERICNAAIELLAKKPLEDISVKELVSAAHVSRSTYYYYFRDPSEVASYLIERCCAGMTELFDRMLAMCARSADETVGALAFVDFSIEAYEYFYDRRAMVGVLMTGALREQFETALINCLRRNFTRFSYFVLDDEGSDLRLPQDELLDLYIRLQAYEMWACLEFWHDNNFAQTPREMAESARWCLHTPSEGLSFRPRGNVPAMVATARRRA